MQAPVVDPVMPKSAGLVMALLAWMESSHRDLPWRQRRDPYAVWVSEIMLQQTRSETVAPYFQRWMLRFPDIESLASASLEEVLKLWEGLGYYARARNLHRAAQQVVAQFGGCLPQERRELLALPGIGRYTAGAILSLAYGLPEPALDGNVKRVLCRLFNVEEDLSRPETQAALWHIASDLIAEAPPGRSGEFNEALMELGALVCRPVTPDCRACPIGGLCLARGQGVQRQRPVRSMPRPRPHFNAVAGVISDHRKRLLIVQRTTHGLLGGLWGFPGDTVKNDRDLGEALKEAVASLVGVAVAVREPVTSFDHAFTHFSITLHAYRCELLAGTPRAVNCRQTLWASPGDMERLPFPVSDRKIIRFLGEMQFQAGASASAKTGMLPAPDSD